jgi:hypothetical protein
VHSFGDADEAVAAVGAVVSDYDTEARAARGIAEGFFDARVVLGNLLRAVKL